MVESCRGVCVRNLRALAENSRSLVRAQSAHQQRGSLALLGMTILERAARLKPCPLACVLVPTLGYPLARFLIQMGVPTKPKALRIWFSRNR